jgi:hypothetical protein
MNTLEFLQAVMPDGNFYFVSEPHPKKDGTEAKRYYACSDLETMARWCESISGAGKDCHYSMAGYEVDKYVNQTTGKITRKTGKNATGCKTLFIDMDCGEGKPFATQAEAIASLVEVCGRLEIPTPHILVSSGNGIHGYWVLAMTIPKPQWQVIAQALQDVLITEGLHIDKVTKDISRLLRPVGTFNYKDPENPKPVRVLRATDGFDPDDNRDFFKTIMGHPAAKKAPAKKSSSNINAALGVKDYPPSDIHKVAQHCNVISEMRSTKGANQDEPLWYAALGVVCKSMQGKEGREICVEFSEGHPSYSDAELDKKLAQLAGVGPTTCEKMREVTSLCEGCTKSVTSPIVLGYADPVHATEVVNEEGEVEHLPDLPASVLQDFRWNSEIGSLVRRVENDEGQSFWVPICEQLPIPQFIYKDHDEGPTGTHYVRIAARTGFKRWAEGDMQLGAIYGGQNQLTTTLANACGVLPTNANEKHLAVYVKTFIQDMHKHTQAKRQVKHMGWQDDGTFVLGNIQYLADGSSQTIIPSKHIANLVSDHMPRGQLQEYVDVIDLLYNKPGWEEYQFVLASAYGSVLIPLVHAGDIGIPIVLSSFKSGGGKTSVANAAMAVWGNPHNTGISGTRTTEHAMYLTAGLRKCLPVLYDEVTSWSKEQAANFAYDYSSGKTKAQGNKDGGIKDNRWLNWQSVVYLTTNNSLTSLVSGVVNNEPKMARLFELNFDKELTPIDTRIMEKLGDNTGVAGHEFIRQLMPRKDKVAVHVHAERNRLNTKLGLSTVARFWVIGAASAIVGFKLAKAMGLHDFDTDRFVDWVEAQLLRMLDSVTESAFTVGELMQDLVNDLNPGFITTLTEPLKHKEVTPFAPGHYPPRGEVTGRIITTTGDMYIPTSAVRQWCSKRGMDFDGLRDRLISAKWLVKWNGFKYYCGRGTSVPTAQTRCWHINWQDVALHLSAVPPVAPQPQQQQTP